MFGVGGVKILYARQGKKVQTAVTVYAYMHNKPYVIRCIISIISVARRLLHIDLQV